MVFLFLRTDDAQIRHEVKTAGADFCADQ
jgi:hypothetical protein